MPGNIKIDFYEYISIKFRVVTSSQSKTTIEGCEFINFGSHTTEQHGGYLNIACSVGMTDHELEELFTRLTSSYAKFVRELAKEDERINSSGRRIPINESFDMEND